VNVVMAQSSGALADTLTKCANAKSTGEKILPRPSPANGAPEWNLATRANAPETPGCSAIFSLRLKQSGAS
jgi:hypothetical protein